MTPYKFLYVSEKGSGGLKRPLLPRLITKTFITEINLGIPTVGTRVLGKE